MFLQERKTLLLSDSSSYTLCDCNLQIVNWRSHLKFPEEARLSLEAKDLISKLLCNVDQRLGTKGAHEIKVYINRLFAVLHNVEHFMIDGTMCLCRHIHGLEVLSGRNYIRWKQLSFLRLMMSWTHKTLKSLRRWGAILVQSCCCAIPLFLYVD